MKRPKTIWKQIWALTLVLAMLGTSLGQPAFTVYAAETENGGENTEDGQSAETPDPEVKCICTELCSEEAVREDCPVCAAEGADLSDCKGVETETQSESGKQINETTPEEEGAGKEESVIELPVETIVPDADALPDNDELFAGYVEQQMYAGRNAGAAPLGEFGTRELTGINLKIYEALKEKIAQVANGSSSSTVIEIPISELGLTQTEWTAEELGITTADQIIEAVEDKLGLDRFTAIDYLMIDCPYELYWYDKTEGVSYNPGIGYYGGAAQVTKVALQGPLQYSFAVVEEYQPSTGEAYTVDTSKTSAASSAVKTAAQIVAENAGKSDYEKLLAYKNEICELVEYNDGAAADEAASYGNPWQLIWVFDGDPNTKVVCEGYAKAFQYLCDLTDFADENIVCYTVTGTMGGGTGAGPHMWNIVTMDDRKNYLVDVTNCDSGWELFLPGVTGSWDSQYHVSTIGYVYDNDTKDMYGETILTLSSIEYALPSPTVSISGSDSITYGDTLTLTASVLHTSGTPVYTWYQNGTEISGQTGSTCTVTGLNASATPYEFKVKAAIGTAAIESAVFEVTVNKKDPDYEVPTGLTAVVGDTLKNVALPAVSGSGKTPGAWSWQNPDTEVGAVGTHEFTAVFTPSDTTNYNTAVVDVEVTVSADLLQGIVLLEGNQYGDTLTARVIGAQEEAKLVYSFYRNGETEPVQTGGNPGYTLKAEDVGKTISVKVTAEGYAGELTARFGTPIQPRGIVVKADSLSKTYGEEDPPLTWNISAGNLVEGDQLKGELTRAAGENAGTYAISQGTLTNENNPCYAITFEPGTLTIRKAEYTVRTTAAVDSEGRQTVIAGIGSFAEPEFISDNNNETVDGTLTYSYDGVKDMTYEAVKEAIAALPVDTKGEITYQFVPYAGGNYTGDKSGRLPFIVKDVEFTVKGEAAEASNAVTVKENPVYGDSWEEILKLAEITATAGPAEDSEKSHFSLNVNGTPDAGTQEYKVLYNGKLNGKTYTDVEVCSGTVEIAKKTVTAEAGSYKVSKVYDGTTNAGTGSGELTVTGILEEDTGVTVSAAPDPYNDPNAGGQTELRVALSLTGEGSGNYQLAETELQVPCEITPREINPVITVTGTYEYTGSPIVPEFTAAYTDEAGQTVQLAETDYTAEFVNNTDAGTAGIMIKPAEGGNYTWEKAEADFTIEKAAYPGITGNDLVLHTSAKYGSAVEFELAAYLAEGAVIGNITLTDVDDVLDGTPSVNGTVLSYKLVNNAETVGDEAVITINITDAKNYRFYNIKITVTVEDKLTQDLKFETAVLEKNYGDADFVNALSGLAEGSTAAYTSSDPAVASVDRKTGEVRILKAGTVQITASASETADYAPADITYTLHIARRALAWDVSELTAVDREDKIADKKASLYGSLKVSGVLAADAEDAVFTCPADQLNGTYATVAAGSQKVALTWADAENPVRLQGEKAENYTLPAALPQITGTIHAKPAVLPVPPESTDGGQYRLEAETGISEVPEALKSIEKLNTPGKIETEMKLAVQRKTSGILPENVVVYDVQLLINVNGTGWVPATEENFPAGGITVTLPYPSGTGKDTHDFTVAHMLTRDMNGMKAGDVEYPSVTKTDGGVQFRVYSLSPISIGWKTVKASAPDTDTGHKDNGNGSGGGSHSSGSPVTQASSAPTGDDSPILLYAVLLAAAAAGIAAVVVTEKKKNKNRR